MKGFIEIVPKGDKPRLINVSYIEEVREIDESHCDIYLAFNCPNAQLQDYVEAQLPYNRVVEMIKEAME